MPSGGRTRGGTPHRRAAARVALLCALATTAWGVGCASGSPGSQGAGAGGRASVTPDRSSPNELSGDELRETQAANLWDALSRLRPQWLRARANASLIGGEGGEPVVYLHEIRHGPLRSLQQMNIDRVRRVRFIDGRDATTRFGTGHGGGVIMVDLDRN